MICRVFSERHCSSVRTSRFTTHVETGRPQRACEGYLSWAPRTAFKRASTPAHDAGLVPLPVSVFFRGALVVLLLALGQADLELRAPVLPVQVERHERVALALHRA